MTLDNPRIVHKFEIPLGVETTINTRHGVVVSVGYQTELTVWIEYRPKAGDFFQTFRWYATGEEIVRDEWRHRGTAHVAGYVWHLYERCA